MVHRRIVVPTDNEKASKHVVALPQTSIPQQNINRVMCFVKEIKYRRIHKYDNAE